MSFFYKENKTLENLINQYFNAIDNYSKQTYDGKVSVILLGSLSRGEATWIETENGFRMVSDIEYFTVYPKGFTDFKNFSEFLDRTAKEVFGNQDSKLFHIDNSFICRQKLYRMERKLLTYDAKCMGKCVAGQNDIPLLPEINLNNINLWDIKDVLTHRMFSALYYGFPLKQEGNLEEYKYCIAKNSLDLMTVMLVNHKKLESGFINRFEVIKTLPIDQSIKDYFEYCLSIKLSSECEHSFSIEQMEDIFSGLVKSLYKDFRIPCKNLFVNTRAVSKRAMGIIKRAIKYKSLPYIQHLSNLINTFDSKKSLSDKQKKNNLIINGYPLN